MPTYVARVRDAKGNAKKEKVVADSLGDARATLRDQGFFVQELKQSESFDPNNIFDLKKFKAATAQVSVKDKAVFSRQFAVLVNAGVAMVRGLGGAF